MRLILREWTINAGVRRREDNAKNAKNIRVNNIFIGVFDLLLNVVIQ